MEDTPESVPLKTVEEKSDEYEFPGVGGNLGTVRKISLSQLNWEGLKSLCREFKLPSSGTKVILTARLKDYSSNRDTWNLSKPGAHRSHKGLREGTKKKPLKGSHKRRAEIIKETDPAHMQRSKDTRSEQEKEDTVIWAKKFIIDHPPRPMSPERENIADNSFVDNKQIYAELTNLREEIKSLTHGHVSSTALALCLVPSTPVVSLNPVLPIQFPSTPPLSPAAPTFSNLTAESLQSPAVNAPPLSNPAPANLTHLTLRDGTTLSFHQCDVLDPKSLTFATDIDLLGRQWTETNPGFKEELCEVKINGRGIALEHWPKVFRKTTRGGKDKRWEDLKKTWDKWRWIGLRYNQSTPVQFWEEFTDSSGKQMAITAISQKLLEQRNAARNK